MRKTNLLITLTTTLTLSMAALTACTVAEASTHAETDITAVETTESMTTTAAHILH